MSEQDDRAAIERVAMQHGEICEGGSVCISPADRDTLVRLAREALKNRADAERLDWLDKQVDDWTYKESKAWNLRAPRSQSIREAIDAARGKP